MIDIEVIGLSETEDALEELRQRTEDLGPAMEAIAMEIKRFSDARFATRTAPDGQPWAPLKGSSNDRGVLRRSVYARGSKDSLVFGASADWADEHQLGTSRMPARPYLPSAAFTSGPVVELWARVRRIIAQHVALNAPAEETPVDDMGFGDFNF